MPQPRLRLYESDGSAVVETITIASTTGNTSAAQAFRLVNDDVDGAVDTAQQPVVTARQEDIATGDPVLRGLIAVDQKWIQIRFLGTGSAGDVHQATGWTPIGTGRAVVVPALSSGGYHDLEIRYAPPFSAEQGQIVFVLTAEDNQTAIALEMGHSEHHRDGLLSGLGDAGFTELVYSGGRTANGSPDELEHFGLLKWVYQGIPHIELPHAEEHDLVDGDSITMVAGEAKWVRWSLGTGLNATSSPKFAAASPDVDDVPMAPAGEIDLGYTFVEYAATAPDIASGDIFDTALVGRANPLNPSGLILSRGPIRGALVDNFLIRQDSAYQLTLDASQAFVWVWLVTEGPTLTMAKTLTATPPADRAYLLYKVPTGPSSITMADLVDYRDTIGGEEMPATFFWAGVPAANAKAYGVHRSARTGYLRLDKPFVLSCGSIGTGNAQGELRVNFKVNGTTVFTAGVGSGSDEAAPVLRWDGSTVDTTGIPEVLAIPPFATFECEVTYPTAFDGTGPSNLSLVARVEVY